MTQLYFARQPIFDAKEEVFAYELFHSDGKKNNSKPSIKGNIATSQVIISALVDIGLEKISGNKNTLIFINLTNDFVSGKNELPTLSEQIAFNIPINVECNEDNLKGLSKLLEDNHNIALDYTTFDENKISLYKKADIIRVNIKKLKPKDLAHEIKHLQKYVPAKILVEGIDSYDEYHHCKKLKANYYQGEYFRKPDIIENKNASINRASTLKILTLLQQPDITVDILQKAISQDVTISYKLLCCINSAQFSLKRKVESIKEAIVYLGLDFVKHWATIIILADIDNKPHELILTSLIRSKMCELIAKELKKRDIPSYSTIGLFSTIDALMDEPMSDLLERLPLTDKINKGLLEGKGEFGRVLKCVTSYDSGEWDQSLHLNLKMEQLQHYYIEAISWATEITEQLIN
ncbi:MAG: HDOD domain-containing protein [Methylococcales bacterium]|nr:HDOD domain-containing protein [Methylococcales bacterium]